ncbi:MAG: flagellar hook-basal body complex protein [Pararobbsia sp.]
MSYAQALSGLDAASTQLDTIGNNIANSSTAGFKASTAEFADLFANSLSTSSSLNTGIGVTTAAIQQDFSQGDFATGTSLDVAINGNGFFRMNAGGVIEYSRDGQFTADKNGFIVNAEGATLTGFPVSASGVVSTTNPGPLQVPQGAMAAQASTQVTAEGLNLDSDLGVPTATPFDPTNSKSFTGTTQVTTIDSLGDTHTIQLFYVANPPSARRSPAARRRATRSSPRKTAS